MLQFICYCVMRNNTAITVTATQLGILLADIKHCSPATYFFKVILYILLKRELHKTPWFPQTSIQMSFKINNLRLFLDRRPKQMFLQRKHTDSQQAHERMLNIANYQEDANQNHNEMLSHIGQDGYYQKSVNKCWRGCEEKETLEYRWWECKSMPPSQKMIWRILKKNQKNSKKKKIELPYDPEFHSLVYIQRK